MLSGWMCWVYMSISLLLLTVVGYTQESNLQENKQEQSMKASSVQITWEFDAPPEHVWAAWTKPELVRQWFGSDPEGKVIKEDMDVRVGGQFEVTFSDSDGTHHTAHGTYRHVEPYKRLEFSWGWKSEPGVETQIKVLLLPSGDGTKMEFEHGNLIQASSHDYQTGWRSTFQKIASALAANSQ
ncbi:SRPBCC domain-containing protein [Saccharophagus sp. K07]|uniref:SRPBCC family protein n=1 Tax=Saccharophagus sp. K07 TaxID=2283636 RepID=UPI00165218D4|nr:SRPBCC domain-containing protein [Saccharophagus sp. K07]MBC6905178.1 SRPBCC domain-containing protein [Saccharophagus sp. K07]